MALFNRKTRDWRDDDYVLLEDLKKKPVEKEIKEEKKEEKQIEKRKNVETVKDRLERIYKKDRAHNSDVKQRLERLKNEPTISPKPQNFTLKTTDTKEKISSQIKEKKKTAVNPEIKKVEKAIKNIENVKGKMDNGSSYLSLFYDLKKAEKAFLEALNEVNQADITEDFKKKINETKSKIRLAK